MLKQELLSIIEFLPSAPTIEGCKRPLPWSQKALLKNFAGFLDKSLPVFHPKQNINYKSKAELAQNMSLSVSELTRKIRSMENIGYIIVQERTKANRQSTNEYLLSPLIPLANELYTAVQNGTETKKILAEITRVQALLPKTRKSRELGTLTKIGKEKAKKQAELLELQEQLLESSLVGQASQVLAKEIHNTRSNVIKLTDWLKQRAEQVAAPSFDYSDFLTKACPLQEVAESEPQGSQNQNPQGAENATRNTEFNSEPTPEPSLPKVAEDSKTAAVRELADKNFQLIFEVFSLLPNAEKPSQAGKNHFIKTFERLSATGKISFEQILANLEIWRNDYYLQQKTDNKLHTLGRLFADLAGAAKGIKHTCLKNVAKLEDKTAAIIGYCESKGFDPILFTDWLFDGKGPSTEEITQAINKIQQRKEHEATQMHSLETETRSDVNSDSTPCHAANKREITSIVKEIDTIATETSTNQPAATQAMPDVLQPVPPKPDPRLKPLIFAIQQLWLTRTNDPDPLASYTAQIKPRLGTYEEASLILTWLKTEAKAA